MRTLSASERIAALEMHLATAITGHARALETLAVTTAKAEALLAAFHWMPAENIDAALEAETRLEAVKRLQVSLCTPVEYASNTQGRWLEANHAELIELLSRDLDARCASRLEYRRAKAAEIGRLSERCAVADGTDVNAEAELFEIESDLARRDEKRDAATAALRDFKNVIIASQQRRSLFTSPFESYQIARAAVSSVDFTIPTNSTKQPISEASPLSLGELRDAVA